MKNTRKITAMGVMLAMIFVLTYIEHSLPPLPLLPPNVKIGLSNVITMYCLFFIGKKEAALLAFLKSVFVFLTRGAMAGILSFCGGMLSVLVLILVLVIFKERISFVGASICGAVAHNLGQITAASFIVGTNIFYVYLPVMIISGILMGSLTGILLSVVMPRLENLSKM